VSTGKPARGRPWKHEGNLEICLAADVESQLLFASNGD
jgi:hypothetical protein